MIDEKTMLLRSAYQIAKRHGESTNWEAFQASIENCLLGLNENEPKIEVFDATVVFPNIEMFKTVGEEIPYVVMKNITTELGRALAFDNIVKVEKVESYNPETIGYRGEISVVRVNN